MLLAVQISLKYYYVIIGITLLTLGLLCILVKENNRIDKKVKNIFYMTYLTVALASIAECLGIVLNGNQEMPQWFLKTVKCLDYIFTPIAGVGLVAQLQRKSIYRKIMHITIVVNTVFQIVSMFTGWMIIVDPQNNYTHGPLYLLYMGMYLLLILLIIVEFISYGQKFSRQNKASLYATVVFAIAGIMTQELSGGQFRIAYLCLAIGMAMLFIHDNEFIQLSTDNTLQEQRIRNMLSQIQPHFIYNSLNAIQAIDGVPQKAQNAIIDFSKFLRENLDSLTGPDLVSFEKEIEHVKKYISLEQLRFGNKVKVNFDIKCKDFMLPVLTLQMLVENAIKHGITKKYEGGTVNIITEETEKGYVITVKDDGIGFDISQLTQNNRVGLNSIKNRLKHFVDGTIEIESEIGNGTTAIVKIPKSDKTVLIGDKQSLIGKGV